MAAVKSIPSNAHNVSGHTKKGKGEDKGLLESSILMIDLRTAKGIYSVC